MKTKSNITKAQQRVLIAKDAIKWINNGVLKPAVGVYFSSSKVCKSSPYIAPTEQLCDLGLGNCYVCAQGALFVAKAFRFKDISFKRFGYGHPTTILRDHFSVDQLDLIEKCFEGWCVGREFRNQYPKTKDRLVAICKNIIANKGTFIPDV